jgi:RNA polymerase sigma factor (sigma-70 family)
LELKQLIHDCKNNNRKAQGQLYSLYSSKLFALCLKYSRNYAEAQDNFQDGFLVIFNKIEQFGFKGSFDGWIKRVMINHVLQQYRKETFLNLVHENIEEDVDINIDEQDVSMDFLLKIIQELPDRYRLVFNLYVIDGYSHQEIAEMLSITTGTTKSNLARARMILKDKIEIYKNNIKETIHSVK